MEVLPPSRGLSEKGILVYFDYLQHRFSDVSFAEAANQIITTQREFPRIADFITHSSQPSVTAEQKEMIEKAKVKVGYAQT